METFFRRTPGDGQTYTFNSTTYSPRIADNSIHFSASQPSQITLPMFDGVTGVGIEEVEQNENSLFVYPNPANESLTLLTAFDESFNWYILDLSGKEVSRGISKQKSTKIDLSSIVPGVYLIQIQTASGLQEIQKFVKQ